MSKQPFRFYVEAGKSKEIIIVDEGITFARNEHALKNPRTGRFDLYLPCIAEHCNCPVCSAHPDKQPYFAAYLTIIDLTEYETNDGETVYFTKRLLEIKQMQQKKFIRLQEQHGSLRGMVLTMTRDSKKDARIGNDIEFSGEVLPEEDLQQYERTYTDREGKEQVIIAHEPYDYEELFPDMTEQQLRAICNGTPEPGSRDFDDDAHGDGFDGDDDQPATTRRPARGAAPQRGAGTSPVRREVEHEEVEEEAEEERPATRRAAAPTVRRTAAAPQRTVPTRRAPPRGQEEAEEEEVPPPRGTSVAERRAALRRGR